MLKVNDFNDGELLFWNQTSHSQCYYRRYTLKEWVRYRAPEQTSDKSKLTFAVDSYALGNILFHLLTKKKPYFELKAMSRAKDHTSTGIPPAIPLSFRLNEDYVIQNMVKLIDQLYEPDPIKRQTSWMVANKLQDIIDTMENGI